MTDTTPLRAPFKLGPMPVNRLLVQLDEGVVRAPVATVFALVRDVEAWPSHVATYRTVRYRSRNRDGGGVVELSARRPFGPLQWPMRWTAHMAVDDARTCVRFRHVEGLTTGLDVEWVLTAHGDGTRVQVFHVWDGPSWPFVGAFLAVGIIGPVFIRGIAERTIAGLKAAAERGAPR